MERLIRAFENYGRAVKIHNALPRSQKEREQHRYDNAQRIFKEEFDAAVSNIFRKRIGELEARIEARFQKLMNPKPEPKPGPVNPEPAKKSIDSAVKAVKSKSKKK